MIIHDSVIYQGLAGARSQLWDLGSSLGLPSWINCMGHQAQAPAPLVFDADVQTLIKRINTRCLSH